MDSQSVKMPGWLPASELKNQHSMIGTLAFWRGFKNEPRSSKKSVPQNLSATLSILKNINIKMQEMVDSYGN